MKKWIEEHKEELMVIASAAGIFVSGWIFGYSLGIKDGCQSSAKVMLAAYKDSQEATQRIVDKIQSLGENTPFEF